VTGFFSAAGAGSAARTFSISKPSIPETTNNLIFMVTQNNVRIDGACN
jgi:hypothetical protein